MVLDEKGLEAAVAAIDDAYIGGTSDPTLIDMAHSAHADMAEKAIATYLSTAAQAGTTEGWRTEMERAFAEGREAAFLEAEDCYARKRWHWMPGDYESAFAWCRANAKGKWRDEIDAAAFAFDLRSDWEAFKLAFPSDYRQPRVSFYPPTLPVVAGGEVGGEGGAA